MIGKLENINVSTQYLYGLIYAWFRIRIKF